MFTYRSQVHQLPSLPRRDVGEGRDSTIPLGSLLSVSASTQAVSATQGPSEMMVDWTGASYASYWGLAEAMVTRRRLSSSLIMVMSVC